MESAWNVSEHLNIDNVFLFNVYKHFIVAMLFNVLNVFHSNLNIFPFSVLVIKQNYLWQAVSIGSDGKTIQNDQRFVNLRHEHNVLHVYSPDTGDDLPCG